MTLSVPPPPCPGCRRAPCACRPDALADLVAAAAEVLASDAARRLDAGLAQRLGRALARVRDKTRDGFALLHGSFVAELRPWARPLACRPTPAARLAGARVALPGGLSCPYCDAPRLEHVAPSELTASLWRCPADPTHLVEGQPWEG